MPARRSYQPSKWLLLTVLLALGVLNIGGLILMWNIDESLIRARMLHAGWLFTVWSYSFFLYLFMKRDWDKLRSDSIPPDGSEDPVDEARFALLPQSTHFIIIGTGALSVLIFLWWAKYASPQLGYDQISYRPEERIELASQIFFAFTILVALHGIYHAERLYRFYTSRRVRWSLFALIGTLCFWMLLGSLALMYGLLKVDALIVSFIPSLVTNILLGYLVIRGNEEHQLQISRATLYKSSTLLAAGIFLLTLGFMGEIIKLIGTHLDFFLAFLTALLILLISLVILLFGSVKERVQRFIARHFYKSLYDYRLEWERANRRILPIQDASALQREVLHAVAEPIGAAHGCLLMRDTMNQFFVAAANGLQIEPDQISKALLDWIWRHGKPIPLESIALRVENPVDEGKRTVFIARDLELLSNIGVSIVVPILFEHQLLAMILLSAASREYTQEDLDFLETIAGQISLALANQKYREAVIESEELENFNRLSTFILHDLKNAGSMLSMVVQNAERNFDNPEFRTDVIRTMNGVAGRIQNLISKLSTPLQQEALAFHPTNLNALIRDTVKMTGVDGLPNIQFHAALSDVPSAPVSASEIQKVLHNLLIN